MKTLRIEERGEGGSIILYGVEVAIGGEERTC